MGACSSGSLRLDVEEAEAENPEMIPAEIPPDAGGGAKIPDEPDSALVPLLLLSRLSEDSPGFLVRDRARKRSISDPERA